jgi:hypothetical protein
VGKALKSLRYKYLFREHQIICRQEQKYEPNDIRHRKRRFLIWTGEACFGISVCFNG